MEHIIAVLALAIIGTIGGFTIGLGLSIYATLHDRIAAARRAKNKRRSDS